MVLCVLLPCCVAGRVVALWIVAHVSQYNKPVLHKMVKTPEDAGTLHTRSGVAGHTDGDHGSRHPQWPYHQVKVQMVLCSNLYRPLGRTVRRYCAGTGVLLTLCRPRFYTVHAFPGFWCISVVNILSAKPGPKFLPSARHASIAQASASANPSRGRLHRQIVSITRVFRNGRWFGDGADRSPSGWEQSINQIIYLSSLICAVLIFLLSTSNPYS